MFCPIGLRHRGNIPGILTVCWKLNFLIYLEIVPNLKSDPSTQHLVKTIYSKFSCLVRTLIFFLSYNREKESKKQCSHLEAICYYSINVQTCISYDPAIPRPGINAGGTHAYLHQYIDTKNAHCSTAHHSQNLKTTQMFISRSMDK